MIWELFGNQPWSIDLKNIAKLQIKELPIENLIPHPKNPRIHPDKAIDSIEKSIKEFGWTNPILLSDDGYILAGHARLKAAKQAGIKTLPTIQIPLSGDKATAYLIADNKLNELTEWDIPELADLLVDLKDIDPDIIGFTENEYLELTQGEIDLGEIDLGGNDSQQDNGEIISCPKCGFKWER